MSSRPGARTRAETGAARRCAISATAMATLPMTMALCAATRAQAHIREATTADITEATTRAAFRADHTRRLARTCVSGAMILKPDARAQMAAGAPRGSAALTDAAAI